MPFSDTKWPIHPEQSFFGTNHYHYFQLPIGPFHCTKFKKILTADPELWGCTIFGPKMVHLPQTIFFKYHSHLPISPLHCANFKKNFPADPELWGCTIFGAKMANLPKWGFFSENLLMSLVSFVHAYLHAKNNYIWAPNTMLSFRKN